MTVNRPGSSEADLAALAALASAARASGAAAQFLDPAVRLSQWAARGRPVTTTGVPKPADAAAAAQAAGLAVPARRITRAAQVPGLVEAWDVALDVGLLAYEDGRACAGPAYGAWPDGADEDVLDVWLTAFAIAAGFVEDEDADPHEDPVEASMVAAALGILAEQPRTAEDLSAAVHEAARQSFDGLFGFLKASVDGDPALQTVALLEDWGVAAREGALLSLTHLGSYVCTVLDLDPGEQVDPAFDAATLIAALEADPNRGPRAAAAWLGTRSPQCAADELLRAAAGASPAGRVMAVTLVQELGAEVLDAWREAATSPGVGPYARLALWESGVGPEPDPDDEGWLAADLAAIVRTLGTHVEESVFAEATAELTNELDSGRLADLIVSIRKSGHPEADLAIEFYQSAQRDEASADGSAGTAGYQLKIVLRDVHPPVWRRVVVPDLTLYALHEVVQRAMGWQECHMHVFEARGIRYGRRDRELGHRDESKVRLSQVLKRAGDKIRYEYDFGDGWEHDIVVEKLVTAVARAACTAGRRSCPPEDCGGAWGYEELLDILADASHERHEELSEWVEDTHGDGFDPEFFDVAAADRAVSRVRPRS